MARSAGSVSPHPPHASANFPRPQKVSSCPSLVTSSPTSDPLIPLARRVLVHLMALSHFVLTPWSLPAAGRASTPCSRTSRTQQGHLLRTQLCLSQKPDRKKGTEIMPYVLRKLMDFQHLARIKTLAETIPMVLCIYIKHYITQT